MNIKQLTCLLNKMKKAPDTTRLHSNNINNTHKSEDIKSIWRIIVIKNGEWEEEWEKQPCLYLNVHCSSTVWSWQKFLFPFIYTGNCMFTCSTHGYTHNRCFAFITNQTVNELRILLLVASLIGHFLSFLPV